MKVNSPGYAASSIIKLGAEPNVIGYVQIIHWSALESGRGVYTFGQLDALLALCKANGKRLMIEVLDRTYGAGTSTSHLPAYLATEPNGKGGWYIKPNGGAIAKMWLPAIMDREIALMQAIAARYDNDPYFEGFTMVGESDPGFSVGPADYSITAMAAQIERLVRAQQVAFAHTISTLPINFIDKQVDGLVGTAVSLSVGITGPDVVPGKPSRGQIVYSGKTESGGDGIDYRGHVPALWHVESPELAGRYGEFTAQQYFDAAMGWGVTHLVWDMKPSDPAHTDWPNEILPFIRAGHPTNTACPKRYSQCDTK